MIHINRDRKTLGKFDGQEVADGLKSGRFLATDLAWRDPMPNWEPLASFTDLPAPSEQAIEEGVQEATPMAVGQASVVQPAWERAEQNLPVGSVVETVKQVLSAPTATFRDMPATGGFLKPMLFYILTGWASGGAALVYQLLAAMINPAMVLGEAATDLSGTLIVVVFVALLVLLPLILIFGLMMSAGFFHLALLMTGGAKKSFEATYRALAYAQGSTAVFQFIPLCGGYLYPVLSLVYSVIALREVHQVELWRVVLAAFLLFMLFCGLAMGVALMFMAIGAAK